MTSNKPYILRALFEWIVDNDLTPYILVNAFAKNTMVPSGLDNDGKIIFNLSLTAIRDFEISNEAVMFSARFNGKPENIYCPIHSVLAIYANENGEGMMFPEETVVEENNGEDDKDDSERSKSTKPSLKLV